MFGGEKTEHVRLRPSLVLFCSAASMRIDVRDLHMKNRKNKLRCRKDEELRYFPFCHLFFCLLVLVILCSIPMTIFCARKLLNQKSHSIM